MATVRTKFVVGLFVISGLTLAIVAIVWIGMAGLIEKGKLYAAYFDESVQGLDKDSPVKYRGVAIGRVQHLGVAPDANLIQVILKIDPAMTIDPGIVAQLKSVGITGLMYVELERKSREEPDLSPRVDFPSKYPVIPTKPSGIKQFMEGVTDVLRQIKELDTKGLSEKIKRTLTNLDRTMNEVQIKEISAGLDRVLKSLDTFLSGDDWRNLIATLEGTGNSLRALSDRAQSAVDSAEETFVRLNAILNTNETGIKTAVDGFNETLGNADTLLTGSTHMVEEAEYRMGQLQSQMTRLLISLEKTSEQLSLLMEQIAQQPSQLLISAPPADR